MSGEHAMRCAVTGANRGIGLELVRQLLDRGADVDAGARDPAGASALAALGERAGERLRIHPLDVTSDDSVRAFAASIGDAAIDLLINNAGVNGGADSLGRIDFDRAAAVYAVNALGPLRVTTALLPQLRRGRGRKIVHITSGLGSIEDNTSGGYYAYRMSKAALNMASRSLAVDLRGEQIISVVINPGWVRTDMGGGGAPVEPAESVAGILRRIDALTLDASGSFLNWRGGEYSW